MRRAIFLITFLTVCSISIMSNYSSAQTIKNDNQSLDRNFYQIQQDFNSYWQNKDITQKGKGWKQFKRWEWFWGQRLYPNGDFPNPMATFLEHKTSKTKKSKDNSIQAVGDWVSLGPTSSNGGYAGIGRLNCSRENPSNSNIIYAGAASGGFWISTNAGSTWATTTDEIASLGVTDIAIDPNNNSIIYIATGDGDAGDTYSVGVLKSTDGGSTWNTTGLNWTTNLTRTITRLLAHPTNSNILYAAASNGIWKTTDAGANWSQVYASAIKDMEFNPSNASIIYASKTGVIKSTDGGSTWASATGIPASGIYRTAIAVTAANSNYVYALCANNSDYGFYGLYRSTDGGASFSQMSSTPNIMGWNTDGSDAGGQGWYDLAFAASSSDANLIFAGGVNLWKSTNGGTNWVNLSNWTSSVHADQHEIYVVPGTTRLYASNDGGIYKSTNSGTNWTWIGSGIKNTQFYRIGCSATNSSLVIGGAQDNGTKLRNGATWTDVIGGDGMECLISHSNSNIQYGELYYGQIRKSTNGGSSFSSMTLPSEYNSGYGSWVTPFIMHPTNANLMFVGYRNVFKTTNGGTSWTQISSFASGSLTLLHSAPSNANYIWASTGSNLMRTTDGGTTWSTLTKPSSNYLTYLAIHPTDPTKVWATFSGYTSGQKVYYSTDAGSTWTNISGNLANVPCNSIVYQKNYYNRVYVGTDIGVFYKDDNNSNWQDFNTNLPNVVVNELEIHEGTNYLRAGTYGRGLWEAELPVYNVNLTAPVLSSPANNATDIAIAPTLSWGAVTDALSYTIQYSTASDFATNTETTSATTSKSLSGLLYNTQYFWRVKAVNGNVSSSWSSTFSFTTINLVLSAPILTAPTDNAIDIAIYPTLSWGTVTDAVSYIIQYSTVADFTTNTETTSVTTSKALSGLNYNTQYYWRVKAVNSNITSPWSSTFNFTTIQLTLSAPNLSSPTNNATSIAVAPTLSWGAVTNATGYTIQYSTSSNFTTYTETTSATTSKALSSLSYSTQYYWRVKATNGNISSDWSSVYSFTTTNLSLSTPTLSSPANGATNRSRNNLAFSWSAVTNATGYTFWISTSSSFSTYTEYTSSTNSLTVSGLGSKIRYYWKVRATNGNVVSSWSSSRYFTTGRTKEIENYSSDLVLNDLFLNSIEVIPNPVSYKSEIIITSPSGSNNSLILYNLLGYKIKEFNLPHGSNEIKIDFLRENLNAGLYILILTNESGATSETIIIE